jgi:hypothetical protein
MGGDNGEGDERRYSGHPHPNPPPSEGEENRENPARKYFKKICSFYQLVLELNHKNLTSCFIRH